MRSFLHDFIILANLTPIFWRSFRLCFSLLILPKANNAPRHLSSITYLEQLGIALILLSISLGL